MITVTGAMNLTTATFGIRVMLHLTGLLTAMAIGTGSTPGAGLGLIIRRGASLPSTMAAGTISRADGDGARPRFCWLLRRRVWFRSRLVPAGLRRTVLSLVRLQP